MRSSGRPPRKRRQVQSDADLAVESSGLDVEKCTKTHDPESQWPAHTRTHARPTQLSGESRIQNELQQAPFTYMKKQERTNTFREHHSSQKMSLLIAEEEELREGAWDRSDAGGWPRNQVIVRFVAVKR